MYSVWMPLILKATSVKRHLLPRASVSDLGCRVTKCKIFIGFSQEGAKDRAHVHMEGSTPWLELLLGISGAFRPKVLTCLMGVTGAGKTTLMDVLAGRKTGEHLLMLLP